MIVTLWFGSLFGILTYSILLHLQLGLRIGWSRKQIALLFGMIMVFVYDVATFVEYQIPDTGRYFDLIRIQSFAGPLFLIFYLEFFSAAAGRRPTLPARVLQALFVLIGLVRQFLPYLGFYSDVHGMVSSVLPWGESIFLVSAEPTLFLGIYSLLAMGTILYCLRYPVAMLRSGKGREAIFLIIAISLLFIANIIDLIIAAGLFKGLYMLETGYVAMIAAGSLSISDEIARNAELKRSLDKVLAEKNVLIREIHHRVKNNLAILVGLVRLQANEEEEGAFHSNLSKIVNRIQSIASVHDMAYDSPDFSSIDLGAFLEVLINNVISTSSKTGVIEVASLPQDLIHIPVTIAVPLGLAVNEIVDNSLKFAFPAHGGKIWHSQKIIGSGSARRLELSVGDDGLGWAPETGAPGSGLGHQLITAMLDQANAHFEIIGGHGTLYHITLALPDNNPV